jgi:hypothetical protein
VACSPPGEKYADIERQVGYLKSPHQASRQYVSKPVNFMVAIEFDKLASLAHYVINANQLIYWTENLRRYVNWLNSLIYYAVLQNLQFGGGARMV